MSMTRISGWLAAAALSVAAAGAHAQAKTPDALIKEVSTDVLDAVKADKSIQSGDIRKVTALVDQKVMPYVNFQRMTSQAVGRYWRQATPEQQKRLQDEFKLLLVRTYSGALSQDSDCRRVEVLQRCRLDDHRAVAALALQRLLEHAQRHACLARRQRRRQQQHQLFAPAALLRSASLAIRPSMPLAPISCAKLLR